MALLEVACPGCGSTLKAPDTMAGKKAKCKKCAASFRLPGGEAADSAGDSHALSATDLPTQPATEAATGGFNFGALYDAVAADNPKPKSLHKAAPPPAPDAKGKKAAAKSAHKAAALPPVEKFEVNDGVPEAKSEVLSLDDDEPEAAAEPFTFPGGGGPELADAGPQALVRSKPTLEEAPRRGGGNYRAKHPRKSGKGMMVIGVVALLAVGGGIGAAVVMMTKKKDPEPVKKAEEKKEDTPPEEKKDDKKGAKDDKKGAKDTTLKTTPKPKDTPGKEKEPAKDVPVVLGPGAAAVDPGPGSVALALPAGQNISLKPLGAKPALFQPPAGKADIEAPFAAIRRVFPTNKTTDGGVVWKSSDGFQGKGEKLTLDMYSPAGRRTDRLEFDGDGRAEPVCDLSAAGDHFAHAADGKITVWKVQGKSKLLDKFDPYADKPEHKRAGIGALYFTADAKGLVSVSTAGAVHLWDVAAKTELGEFVPPKATPGRVAQGKGVAITPERDSIAVAVGGTITQVGIGDKLDARPLADLKGDVGKSLAMGTVAGKVLYAFETADKKEKAVMLVAPDGTFRVLRVPAAAGDPVSAGWADGQMAVVGTSTGAAMWFEVEDGKFLPIAVIQTTGNKATHVAGVACHWYLLPNATNPMRTTMLELAMPPEGLVEYRELADTKKTAHTFKLDAAGLTK